MNEFKKLCKMFSELDRVTYGALLSEKSSTLLPKLVLYSEDGITGCEIFSNFIIASIASDGRLDESEFELVRPLLFSLFGSEFNYDDAKTIFMEYKKDLNKLEKAAKEMSSIFGKLDENLQDDIFLTCLMICSIDGKVSHKEKKFLKGLLN